MSRHYSSIQKKVKQIKHHLLGKLGISVPGDMTTSTLPSTLLTLATANFLSLFNPVLHTLSLLAAKCPQSLPRSLNLTSTFGPPTSLEQFLFFRN